MPLHIGVIRALVKLSGCRQLDYHRLYLSDYTPELGRRPAPLSIKLLSMPSFFLSLFNEQYNVDTHTLSGKQDSFWHCLLYILYPRYTELSWHQRKSAVAGFISAVDGRSCGADMPSELEQRDITRKLGINLILVDTTKITYICQYDMSEPTLILYRDDSPTFHVVEIDDRHLFTTDDAQDSRALKNLIDTMPIICDTSAVDTREKTKVRIQVRKK
jgi:hypothetical protein